MELCILTDGVKFTDNSVKVKQMIEQNKMAALQAMGVKAVGLIVTQMQSGYGKAIRDTGDLMRDVNFEVERSKMDTVDVGNSLEYAPFVHDGTHKMAARPYIRDAIQNGADQIRAVGSQELKRGF